MQILMKDKIKKRIQKILDDTRMIVDDCSRIISYAYQWVESQDLKKSYPGIIFYRNWIEHVKLSKKVVDKKILVFFKEIYKQFSISQSIKSTSDYIAEQLSTKKLRNELKRIFEEISCCFPVLDSLNMWKKFMGCLCNELLYKPLEINKIEKLLDKPLPGNYLLPYNLILTRENSHILYKIQICKFIVDSNNVNTYSTFPGITVTGKFPLDEVRADFLND